MVLISYDEWATDDYEEEMPNRYPDFYKFLEKFEPNWKHEYSGNIYGMWVAFEAGKEYAKTLETK